MTLDLFAPHVALAQAGQAALVEGWLALLVAREGPRMGPEAIQAATSAQRLARELRQRLEHLAGHLGLDRAGEANGVAKDVTTRGSGF